MLLNMLIDYLIVAGFVVIVLVAIGLVFAKLYVRAPKDTGFVRTGLGGQRVILDGGALVLPVLHNVIWVNLRTLRLEVSRQRELAMITFDRMRVDIGVEFYVRVKPNAGAMSLAAQTLGGRTLEGSKLKELIEAKFVDALRGVAAQMTINDLHEKRTDFVQKVQNAVAGDLEQNGLELESVSLTNLDQTPAEFFDPNNAFDAEGLTRLTEITENKKRDRNEIEQSTRIAIEQRNLDADRRSIEITQEKEYAKLDADRNVASRSAETHAATAEQEAESDRVSREAAIEAQLSVRRREIESERDVELSRQEKAIVVAGKSRDESKAQAEANEARAEAVSAEEKVKTVAQVAEAERIKQVAIVSARQGAETEAVSITVAAEAERRASEDRAEAALVAARADGEAIKIEAGANAVRYKVDAEGQEAVNEARNVLDADIIAFELKKALIDVLPQLMEASMKPIEKISDIRIVDMGSGPLSQLNGGGTGKGSGHGATNGGGDTLPDSIVKSLMNYRIQAPLVDELLTELGLDPKQDVGGLARQLAVQTHGVTEPVPSDRPDSAPVDER